MTADASRTKLPRTLRSPGRGPVVLLALLMLGGTGCSSDVAEMLGISDVPPAPPVALALLCDTSGGSTCDADSAREVVSVMLRAIIERPSSMVTVWALGASFAETIPIIKIQTPVLQDEVEPWVNEQAQAAVTALGDIFKPRTSRSPIAAALGQYNATSHYAQLRPVYVDPQPGKAQALAREGRATGMSAEYQEGTIQTALRDNHDPVFLNLDHPQTLAECLEATGDRPTLAYTLIVSPKARMYGVPMLLTPDDPEDRRLAVRLFQSLAAVTANTGAQAVFGLDRPAEHVWQEPAYRTWFAEHMTKHVYRVVAGVPSEATAIAITLDGRTAMPLMITEGTQWQHTATLANQVVNDLPYAIRRGQQFAVADVLPEGIRIHPVRIRHTDAKTAVYEAVAIDPDTVDTHEEENLRLRARAEELLRRAEQDTITRRDAALMTD